MKPIVPGVRRNNGDDSGRGEARVSGRDNGRVIEGTLSLGILLLVLFPVWGLVFAGKMHIAPPAC